MHSRLRIVREQVAALRQALLSPTPEGIDACLPGLAEAACSISHAGLTADDEERRAFKRELRSVNDLLRHGEQMNRGLARLLGARMAGYTSTGDPAAIHAPARLSLQG
jgi:hypothetical protein